MINLLIGVLLGMALAASAVATYQWGHSAAMNKLGLVPKQKADLVLRKAKSDMDDAAKGDDEWAGW